MTKPIDPDALLQVWRRFGIINCLRHGWPKCYGYTMTIDLVKRLDAWADEVIDAALASDLDAAKDCIQSLTADNAVLREALKKCRSKFQHYEQLHRLKCTSEGDEKADRNRDMADMCDAALEQTGAEQ